MSPESIFFILLIILTLDFILDQTLEILNLRHQKNSLPKELQDVYDKEKFNQAQDYQQTNTKFGFITSSFSFILLVMVLWSGALGKMDMYLRQFFQDPILLSLVFFGIIFLITDLLNIPFSVYKIFVIEERFGFNKTTVKTFIADKIKGYLLTFLFGGIILFIFLYLVIDWGENFWIWFWLVTGVVMLLINMFYTSIILPLFNKLSPLPEGELRDAIMSYCQKVNFPLDNLFVIDGSKRSAKANAFFSGIGKKKKIVLYDTLIENHSKDELVAVLAHEVGHFKKKHVIYGLVLSLVQMGVTLYLLSLFIFSNSLSEALGASQLSIPLNLIAFTILYSPISHIVGIFMNIISRKNEYEADAYAAETYTATPLAEALKKLSKNNLSNLTPHPAYVFFHYSHPPLIKRLRNLTQYNK